MPAIRNKSPQALMRDKVLDRWRCSVETTTPVDRKWPPMLVATLADRCKTSRPRINRWLHDPDGNPLEWRELQEIAAEVGGYLRVMFSVRHK